MEPWKAREVAEAMADHAAARTLKSDSYRLVLKTRRGLVAKLGLSAHRLQRHPCREQDPLVSLAYESAITDCARDRGVPDVHPVEGIVVKDGLGAIVTKYFVHQPWGALSRADQAYLDRYWDRQRGRAHELGLKPWDTHPYQNILFERYSGTARLIDLEGWRSEFSPEELIARYPPALYDGEGRRLDATELFPHRA